MHILSQLVDNNDGGNYCWFKLFISVVLLLLAAAAARVCVFGVKVLNVLSHLFVDLLEPFPHLVICVRMLA